jgi:predicted 3-demethylubiquinone-9 3-methyltransferase (glyoxalase superfamily)
MSRDSVADDQWNQQFAYQKERDKVADEQWAKEYALKAAAAARAAARAGKGAKTAEEEERLGALGKTAAYLVNKNGRSAQANDGDLTNSDAYQYAFHLMNNTYGPEGENAAVGHLMRLVNEGGLTEEQFDWITDKLGVTEEKLDMDKIAQYL